MTKYGVFQKKLGTVGCRVILLMEFPKSAEFLLKHPLYYYHYYYFRFVLCTLKLFDNKQSQKKTTTNIFQVKPFWCQDCLKTFSSQSKLKQHMLVHSEEKPYSCSVCARAFNVVSNLRRHLRTVHKEFLNSLNELDTPAKTESPISV